MQIWLGKQGLGQRDKPNQGVSTELQIRIDLSTFDDAELAEYGRLANKYSRQSI